MWLVEKLHVCGNLLFGLLWYIIRISSGDTGSGDHIS